MNDDVQRVYILLSEVVSPTIPMSIIKKDKKGDYAVVIKIPFTPKFRSLKNVISNPPIEFYKGKEIITFIDKDDLELIPKGGKSYKIYCQTNFSENKYIHFGAPTQIISFNGLVLSQVDSQKMELLNSFQNMSKAEVDQLSNKIAKLISGYAFKPNIYYQSLNSNLTKLEHAVSSGDVKRALTLMNDCQLNKFSRILKQLASQKQRDQYIIDKDWKYENYNSCESKLPIKAEMTKLLNQEVTDTNDPCIVISMRAESANLNVSHLNSIYQKKDKMKELASFAVDVISYEAYFQARSSRDELKIDPLSKELILGIIPLGPSMENVKQANDVIKWMFGGTKNNHDIMFAILWQAIEEFAPKDSIVAKALPFVREHMLFRLQNCDAGLNFNRKILAFESTSKLGYAVWYILASASKECTIDMSKRPFAMSMDIFPLLLKLNELQGFQLPPIDLCPEKTYAAYLLMKIMREGRKPKKVLRRGETIVKGLYQKMERINITKVSQKVKEELEVPSFVPIEGPADEEQIKLFQKELPNAVRELSIEEIVGITMEFDRNTKPSDIVIEKNWVPKKFEVAESCPLKFTQKKLCPNTMRPYMGQEGSDFYYDLYCDFVRRFASFPSPMDLVAYANARIVDGGRAKCLPAEIVSICETVVSDYKVIKKSIPVQYFHMRFEDSRRFNKRKEMEQSLSNPETVELEISD